MEIEINPKINKRKKLEGLGKISKAEILPVPVVSLISATLLSIPMSKPSIKEK